MRKKLGILAGLILILFILNKLLFKDLILVYVKDGTVENSLESKLGDDYFVMYDYDYIEVGPLNIIRDKSTLDFYTPKFEGTEKEKFTQIIDYLERFNYLYNQPDPNLVDTEGGNCQALSIMLYEICKVNNIECHFLGETDHVSCVLEVNKKNYKVDLTTKQIEIIKE